jgi:hypothetical protein
VGLCWGSPFVESEFSCDDVEACAVFTLPDGKQLDLTFVRVGGSVDVGVHAGSFILVF